MHAAVFDGYIAVAGDIVADHDDAIGGGVAVVGKLVAAVPDVGGVVVPGTGVVGVAGVVADGVAVAVVVGLIVVPGSAAWRYAPGPTVVPASEVDPAVDVPKHVAVAEQTVPENASPLAQASISREHGEESGLGGTHSEVECTFALAPGMSVVGVGEVVPVPAVAPVRWRGAPVRVGDRGPGDPPA